MNHELTLWERHAITWITAHMIDQADNTDLPRDHVVEVLRTAGYTNSEIAEVGEVMEHWCKRMHMPRDLTVPQLLALKIVIEESDICRSHPDNPFPKTDPEDARAGVRLLAAKLEERGFPIYRMAT